MGLLLDQRYIFAVRNLGRRLIVRSVDDVGLEFVSRLYNAVYALVGQTIIGKVQLFDGTIELLEYLLEIVVVEVGVSQSKYSVRIVVLW